jgi:hypothetical protein
VGSGGAQDHHPSLMTMLVILAILTSRGRFKAIQDHQGSQDCQDPRWGTTRGNKLEDFEDAFARYLPPESVTA